MECRYREEVKLRENEEEKLLLGCYGREDEQDSWRLQAKVLEQKHQEELFLLRKESERVKNKLKTLQINHNLVKGVVVSSDIVVNTMREERDNALKLLHEIKAKDSESKYKNELRKALIKEKQSNVERDNALKLVHEITTKHDDMCIKVVDVERKYKNELRKALIKKNQSNVDAMREERDIALGLVHEITMKHDDMRIKANYFESKYKNSNIVAMGEERDNALKLVHEITTKHEDMCIKAEEFENKYNDSIIFANTMREERDNALKLVHEITTKHEDMCIKAKDFESKYKDSHIVANTMREERDNALKLVHEITTKHEDMCIKAKDFESKYKDSHIVANTMREERDNALKLVHEITTKHEDMCIKAKDFESKYKNTNAFRMCTKAKDFEIKYENELILRKALLKENQELLKKKQELEIDVDAKRKERDNAIKLVNEITTKEDESFICPILLEVMKDPQMTSDGYTYEAEAIRTWLNIGRNRSPMTNLELSHTNLAPNRALRSAIQNRFDSSLLIDLV